MWIEVVMLGDALIQIFVANVPQLIHLMKVNKINTDGDTTFLRYDAASTGNWIPVL
jgi:hypothetical protein